MPESRPPETRPLCVLLVEDDKDSLSALTRLLRLSGHKAIGAATAAEAVRLAAAQRCDVVISDVGLPDRSGLDLMRELSAAYNLPGIAVSGYTDAADVRECTSAGFNRHLKKPIDFQALLNAVEELGRPGGGFPPDSQPGAGSV
jgi:CheY-like chemotaxis protein